MKHRQNSELLPMKALHGSVLGALFLAMAVLMADASVHAFTFAMDVTGRGGGGIGSYRPLMEENLPHTNPSGTVPDVHPNALGFSFRPGLADVIDLTVGASWSVAGTGNQDAAAGAIYGWAPNSGNDVVYEKTANPVAERSTMFLVGCGLVGLARLGRKRLFRAPAAHHSPLPWIATGSRETQG